MSKPIIPDLPKGGLPDRQRFDSSVKETLEILTGRRKGSAPIEELSSAATLDDCIAKINEIVVRLNA